MASTRVGSPRLRGHRCGGAISPFDSGHIDKYLALLLIACCPVWTVVLATARSPWERSAGQGSAERKPVPAHPVAVDPPGRGVGQARGVKVEHPTG
jgi:hypothetical protein